VQPVDEQGQAQQAVDDRRHGREVVDVDLDDVGPAVLRRELFQIDSGHHADRHGDQGGDHQHHGRADHRAQHAGLFRLGRVGVGEEGEVEARLQRAVLLQLLQPVELLVVELAIALRGSSA
jgi:hypothetical protein